MAKQIKYPSKPSPPEINFQHIKSYRHTFAETNRSSGKPFEMPSYVEILPFYGIGRIPFYRMNLFRNKILIMSEPIGKCFLSF